MKNILSLFAAVSLLTSCSPEPLGTGNFKCTCVRTGFANDQNDGTFIKSYVAVTKEFAEYECQHSALDYDGADPNYHVTCTLEEL